LKGHRTDYPTLYALALDILPIQASSVPCERIFSSAKETTNPRRNRIRPKLMEALQILKSAIKLTDLDFTVGSDRETELAQLEYLMEEEVIIPNDVNKYMSSLKREHEAQWTDNDEDGTSDVDSSDSNSDNDDDNDNEGTDFSFSMDG